MRKKDPSINENIDNPGLNNQKLSRDTDPGEAFGEDDPGQFTEVKNASASGLGTMGRSDEKLADQSREDSANTY